jgi:protein-S-isoprenylcysteine O-methyltransferase Ste14
MNIRKFFFRYRGVTPVPFGLLLLYQSNLTRWGFCAGLIIIALGESIRIAGVRMAGGRTRTRNVGANKLCTDGVFAYVRNPLYLGNILVYVGFAITAGGPWVLYLTLISLVYFSIQYAFIISLEESKLQELFGEEYAEYTHNVPRLIPRLRAWQKSPKLKPKSWRKVLHSEKSTLLNQGFFLAALIIKELFINKPNVF